MNWVCYLTLHHSPTSHLWVLSRVEFIYHYPRFVLIYFLRAQILLALILIQITVMLTIVPCYVLYVVRILNLWNSTSISFTKDPSNPRSICTIMSKMGWVKALLGIKVWRGIKNAFLLGNHRNRKVSCGLSLPLWPSRLSHQHLAPESSLLKLNAWHMCIVLNLFFNHSINYISNDILLPGYPFNLPSTHICPFFSPLPVWGNQTAIDS